jgi:DoxX
MHIPKVVGFFTSLGIPLPAFNACFVSSLELVGGALLFLGLGSRIIALPLTIDMLVAYITADREALFPIFSDPGQVLCLRRVYIPLCLRAYSHLWPRKNLCRLRNWLSVEEESPEAAEPP